MSESSLFRRIANFLLRVLFRILLRLEIVGTENVPREGAFIAMINHVSFLDPVLTVAIAPREIVAMSKIENYANPIAGLVLRLYGSFPIRRGEMDMQAIRTSLRVLRDERGLLMAPEGTRSKTCALLEGRDGMVMIALRGLVPIVPVAISGSERFKYNWRRLRRTPTRVVFGEAFCLQPRPGTPHRKQMRHMTREAMYRLAALLPEEYRGVYGDSANATTEFLVPSGRRRA
jgi:1-acyl-sn-glycerol-3-phosphate acyltransferase